MKRLLLSALFIALCPGAKAVDYLACEAIDKAAERLYVTTFNKIAEKQYRSGGNRLERQNNELINSMINADVEYNMKLSIAYWGTADAKKIPAEYREYGRKMRTLGRDNRKYGCI